jgi:hypothetical protein
MDIPVWLQNVLLTFLLAGVVAPGTLLLPEGLQGMRALLAVLVVCFVAVIALRRRL